jgi:glycylpeptide N-tetradecanoyltransferase
VNILDTNEAEEVYQLLTQNYVEDDDNMFRFDYSIPFLQWALTPPGYHKEWLFGVRGGKKNKLFGLDRVDRKSEGDKPYDENDKMI